MQAKTYYICGVVLHSVRNQAANKKMKKKLLSALDNLSVDGLSAAKSGLPTRHVTLKSRGGLLFASGPFYQLMSQVEDRFYSSTVLMRENFALAREDVINNIREGLLLDSRFSTAFNAMIPAELVEECGEMLWTLVADRISNLHGTELAVQLNDNLASLKRKSASNSVRDDPKLEALRAARKKKKIERTHEIFDLTLEDDVCETTVEEPTSAAGKCATVHALGDEVTAIEGTGSATQQWPGHIVEVDHYNACYIVCCKGVLGYPKGYNMLVPFTEVDTRINQPIHSHKRKRKRKVIPDMSY